MYVERGVQCDIINSNAEDAHNVGSMAPALPDQLQDSVSSGRFPLYLHSHDAKQQNLQHTETLNPKPVSGSVAAHPICHT